MNFIYTITLEDQEIISTRLQIGDEVDSRQLDRTLHYLQVATSLIHEMSLTTNELQLNCEEKSQISIVSQVKFLHACFMSESFFWIFTLHKRLPKFFWIF